MTSLGDAVRTALGGPRDLDGRALAPAPAPEGLRRLLGATASGECLAASVASPAHLDPPSDENPQPVRLGASILPADGLPGRSYSDGVAVGLPPVQNGLMRDDPAPTSDESAATEDRVRDETSAQSRSGPVRSSSPHDLEATIAATEAWLEERRVDTSALGWDDYIGATAAKAELRSVIARLLRRRDLAAVGMAIPKGILIHGEPGVGKTYLARVMAAEILRAGDEIDFFEITAAELDSVERLSEVLAALRRRPRLTIVALDEADLLGLERWNDDQTPETRAILLSLLSALDGLRALEGVFWVLTANRDLDSFDPALVRPGRIDLAIGLRRPTPDEREELFRYYARRVPMSSAVDLEMAAEIAGAVTPAKVRGVVADAYALALTRDALVIETVDLIAALRRDGVVELGSDAERKLWAFAVHEAGHAIASALLHRAPTLVVAARHGGGFVEHEEESFEEADVPYTLAELRAMMASRFAGVAAERAILGVDRASTGNASDMASANQIAKTIVLNGLLAGVAPFTWDVFGPEGVKQNLPHIVALLEGALAEAERIVAARRDSIEHLARRLVVERHLAGETLRTTLAEALAIEPRGAQPPASLVAAFAGGSARSD